MLAQFDGYVAAMAAKLRGAHDAGDLTRLRTESHSLKGSSAYIGATMVPALAQRLQDACTAAAAAHPGPGGGGGGGGGGVGAAQVGPLLEELLNALYVLQREAKSLAARLDGRAGGGGSDGGGGGGGLVAAAADGESAAAAAPAPSPPPPSHAASLPPPASTAER